MSEEYRLHLLVPLGLTSGFAVPLMAASKCMLTDSSIAQMGYVMIGAGRRTHGTPRAPVPGRGRLVRLGRTRLPASRIDRRTLKQ